MPSLKKSDESAPSTTSSTSSGRKESFRSSAKRRWGHRRSNSVPIKVEPIDAMAAAAASGTRSLRPSPGPNGTPPVERRASTVEIVEEVEGLTALTLTSKDKERPVSFVNTALPDMIYAGSDIDKPRLTRSGSENSLQAAARRSSECTTKNDSGSVLDYWRMEKQLRLAQDELRQKREAVEEMEKHKAQMEQEMADLQLTLFEEAHEMVRAEKEARHKDNTLLRETQDRASVLMEELKALKALVADHVVKDETPTPMTASSPPLSPVETEKGNIDSQLYNEFMKWHLKPSLRDDTDYMKRVLTEDISPCLRFHPSTIKISNAILKTIVDNALVIEAIQPGKAEPLCRLSKAKRQCTYRVKVRKKVKEGAPSDTPPYEWIHVCTPTRNRIIAVANFFTYARYIVQGLVKSTITDVYWKMVDLRLQVNKARLGMLID